MNEVFNFKLEQIDPNKSIFDFTSCAVISSVKQNFILYF